MANTKLKHLYSDDPIIRKEEDKIRQIEKNMEARRQKLAERDSKLLKSAKLSVIDFELSKNNTPNSLEGLKEVLNSVTAPDSNGEKTTWLELYEKYLKDKKLREAFGFSKIEEDNSEG